MGTQFNDDQKTVRLFFFIFGEIQSTSLAEVQEEKNYNKLHFKCRRDCLVLESTIQIRNNRTFLLSPMSKLWLCLKVLVFTKSLTGKILNVFLTN